MKTTLFFLILANSLYAGAPFRVDAQGGSVGFDTNQPLTYMIDTQALNETFDLVTMRTLVTEAFEIWNQVDGSALRIQASTARPLYSDVGAVIAAANTLQSPVVFDQDGSILATMGFGSDTLGVGLPLFKVGRHYGNFAMVLNGPALVDYDVDAMRALLLHLAGRCLGLSYTAVNGPRFGEPQGPPIESVEAMFPGLWTVDGRTTTLTADDRAGLLALYGATRTANLTGIVHLSDGVRPADGVGVVARNLADPWTQAYSTITQQHSGRFAFHNLPPGEYTVEVTDPGLDEVHGLALRTDQPPPAHRLILDSAFREWIIGPFPGPSEFWNLAESNNPARDRANEADPVMVTAETVTDIAITFNRRTDATRLIYPWISNRQGIFESQLIVDNLADTPVHVTLTAYRRAETLETETVVRQIPPGGFLAESAATLFPQMGDGAGYSVVLEAPGDAVRGRWVTNSLQAASGASPSQGVAVPIDTAGERAGKRLSFGYLPSGDGVLSAPVLVNLDDQPADITLRFVDAAGQEVGVAVIEGLPPFEPVARVTGDFLDTSGDLAMIAETSGAAITGVSFVFDQTFSETSIGNATAVPDAAPTTLIYPWLSNRADQFESILVVNNHSDQAVELTLTARRQGGDSQTTTRTIPPGGFLAETSSTLFDQLGDGLGYAIEATGVGALSGLWVTNNLAAASGRSPSVGVAVRRTDDSVRTGQTLLLGYLPVTGSQISAPVLVNLADTQANATLQLIDRHGDLIVEQSFSELAPLEPLAIQTAPLLPEWSGDVYAVVHSDQPLTAVAFVFDQTFKEPAIGNAGAVATTPTHTTLAFTGVNLITMTDDQVLADQDLLVRNAKIINFGPSGTIAIPDNAQRINGQGQYLMPGLADAHTHISAEGDLILNLANGVTSILNMGDHAFEMLDMRRKVHTGQIPGPTIYAGQQIFGGDYESPYFALTAHNTDEARRLAEEIIAAGYDYLKTYEEMDQELLAAVADVGRKHDVHVIGHLVDGLPLETALDEGLRMVAHVEELLNDYFKHNLDPALIPPLIDLLLAKGTTVTTTLSTVEAILTYGDGNLAGYQQLLARPGVEYLEPWQRQNWDQDFASKELNVDFFRLELDFMYRVARELMEAGVPLILGTDAPILPGLVSGFVMHEELRIVTETGWTNYQALHAATAGFGAFVADTIKNAPSFGTIAPGYMADLILLDANPLEDVTNLRNPAGVMARGQWYDQTTLQHMLDEVAATYEVQKSKHPKRCGHRH